MEQKYKMRIYLDGDLITKWKINEGQKHLMEALMEADVFYEGAKFKIEKEEEEYYEDFT